MGELTLMRCTAGLALTVDPFMRTPEDDQTYTLLHRILARAL